MVRGSWRRDLRRMVSIPVVVSNIMAEVIRLMLSGCLAYTLSASEFRRSTSRRP